MDPSMAGLRGVMGPQAARRPMRRGPLGGAAEGMAHADCKAVMSCQPARMHLGQKGYVPDQLCKACNEQTAPAACFGHAQALTRFTEMQCSAYSSRARLRLAFQGV